MVSIRLAVKAAYPVIATLTREAFEAEEEVALVETLRNGNDILAELVAENDGAVLGHVIFCRGEVKTENAESYPVALLGIVSVAKAHQREGIGKALIETGLALMKARGEGVVFVVGHADYYPRFGFDAELADRWSCRWAGPHFMAVPLAIGAEDWPQGEVRFPDPFYLFD